MAGWLANNLMKRSSIKLKVVLGKQMKSDWFVFESGDTGAETLSGSDLLGEDLSLSSLFKGITVHLTPMGEDTLREGRDWFKINMCLLLLVLYL